METRCDLWAVGKVPTERAGKALLERAGVSGRPVQAGDGTWWLIVDERATVRALEAVVAKPYGVWELELENGLDGEDAHKVSFRLTEHGADGTVSRAEDERVGEGLVRGGVGAEVAIEYFQKMIGDRAQLSTEGGRAEPPQDRIAGVVLRRLVEGERLELETGRRWEELRRRAAQVLLQARSIRKAADSLAELLIDAGEVAELHASEDELVALLTEAGYRPPL